MNEDRLNSELEELEKELAAMRPAPAPESLLNRLRKLPPRSIATQRGEAPGFAIWFSRLFRPLAATAVVIMAAVSAGWWLQVRQHDALPKPTPAAQLDPVLTASEVDIEQTLVASFETVARLPDGQSVRFRYEEWLDEFRVRDDMRGMVVERREPRVELVPIRSETY